MDPQVILLAKMDPETGETISMCRFRGCEDRDLSEMDGDELQSHYLMHGTALLVNSLKTYRRRLGWE
jgi:hypothetical protein